MKAKETIEPSQMIIDKQEYKRLIDTSVSCADQAEIIKALRIRIRELEKVEKLYELKYNAD